MNCTPHRIDRRALLAGALALAACKKKGEEPIEKARTSGHMPVLFLAHGAPTLLEDVGWVGELERWARSMQKPAGVLMVCAHWEARPATLGATETVPLVYDFVGFPQHHYQRTYEAPGAPELAARVRGLLGGAKIPHDDAPSRGLDHGAYVPLVAMFPKADVPVLQLSLPGLDLRPLFALGRALAPLREERVLVIGSGFLTHNMRYAGRAGTPAFASEFDAWVAEAIQKNDVDALIDFRDKAPGAKIAHPTIEHYAPLLVAEGAASVKRGPIDFPITGFWDAGAFTRRSVQYG